MPRPSLSITAVEDLHADAGWRDFSFLKLTPLRLWSTLLFLDSANYGGIGHRSDAEMAAEDERMSEKQRKNRRKAEKAKEASAQREVERLERLQETIRQRAAGRG